MGGQIGTSTKRTTQKYKEDDHMMNTPPLQQYTTIVQNRKTNYYNIVRSVFVLLSPGRVLDNSSYSNEP